MMLRKPLETKRNALQSNYKKILLSGSVDRANVDNLVIVKYSTVPHHRTDYVGNVPTVRYSTVWCPAGLTCYCPNITRQTLEYRVVVMELNSFDKKSMFIASNVMPGKLINIEFW